jgi:hypothetical protein
MIKFSEYYEVIGNMTLVLQFSHILNIRSNFKHVCELPIGSLPIRLPIVFQPLAGRASKSSLVPASGVPFSYSLNPRNCMLLVSQLYFIVVEKCFDFMFPRTPFYLKFPIIWQCGIADAFFLMS